jgi:plastocyanin
MSRRVLVAAVTLVVLALVVAGPVHALDEVPVTIENNRFAPEEIKVKAGAPFVIVVTNKDKTPEEFESKELRIEKVVPPGKTLRINVRALKPGTYPFIGEYHQQTAKGRIVAE